MVVRPTDPTQPTAATLNLARALIDASPSPMLLFDGELRIVGVSRTFSTTFGIVPGASQGLSLAQLGDGEWAQPQLGLLLENALLGGAEIGDYETDLVRPDLPTRRLAISVLRLLHGEAGDRAGALVLLVVNDLTDSRRVEEANIALLIKQDHLLEERAMLLQEMQHRVANSLQIIASVLMLKARAVNSEESRQHLRDAHDRVLSVAVVQRHLQEHRGDVEIGPYLGKLCESLAASMIGEERELTLTVRADPAVIESHEAVSLGLVVTEMVINALKHAFPGERDGAIVVDYALHPPGWSLSITDNGVGRPVDSTTVKAGLGTSVVEALAQQLGARVVISDAMPGARITLVNEHGPGRLPSPNRAPEALAAVAASAPIV